MSFAFRWRSDLLAHLGLEEFPHRPDAIRRKRGLHVGEQRCVAGEQARLDQRRHDADIGDALRLTFLHRAHAMTDLQADVPKEGEQPFGRAALRGIWRARHQQQDVDVGAEMQLAAPIASHRDQRPGDHRGDGVRAPGFSQHHIDQRRPGMHQGLDRLFGQEAGLQLLVGLAQQLAPCRARALRLGKQGWQALQPGPAGIGGRGGQGFLEEIDVSGGHGRPQWTRRSAAPSVSTS